MGVSSGVAYVRIVRLAAHVLLLPSISVLRALLHRLPSQSSAVSVFADDVGAACKDIFKQLTGLLRVSARLGDASGLTVNASWSILLITVYYREQALCKFQATGFIVSSFRIQDHAEYLGVITANQAATRS